MRFSAFILAIIVLVLSCLPCTDSGATALKARTEVSSSKQLPGHAERDFCTPFCVCSCCSAVYFTYSFPVTTPPVVTASNIYISFLSAPLIEIAYAIWQPPQL
ncbi:MAG: hypothetical protein J0I41_19685 [Filimonas sp.]|nr:hypothetical protein [Filimonas sp.]